MDAVHEVGGKVFDAQNKEDAEEVADILDLAVASGAPSKELVEQYHSFGNKVFSYANPSVAEEIPETYRRNYGIILWKGGYDGAMNWAYQASFYNIWNDFDYDEERNYRDMVFTYPTMNGVIDTIQWEGFREGVDDIRYLTTMLNTVDNARHTGDDEQIKLANEAEAWLNVLDTRYCELYDTRSQLINYSLRLKGRPTRYAIGI